MHGPDLQRYSNLEIATKLRYKNVLRSGLEISKDVLKIIIISSVISVTYCEIFH